MYFMHLWTVQWGLVYGAPSLKLKKSPVPSVSAVQRRSDTVHDHLSRRWVRYKGGQIQSTITCPVGECGTKAVRYSPRSPVPSVSAVQRRSDTVHDHLSRRWVRYNGGRIQSTITCPIVECGTKAVRYSPRSPVPSVSAVQRRSDTVHDHLSRRWVQYKGGRIQSTITCPVGECGTKAVGYSPRSPVPSVSAVQRRSDTVHDHLSHRWVRYNGSRIQSTITCPVGECGTMAVGYSPRSLVPSVSAVQRRSDTVHDHLFRRWVRYKGGRIQSTITCPVGECGTMAVGYSPRSPVPSVSAVQRRSDTVHDHLFRRWVRYKGGRIQSTITCSVGECGTKAVGYSPRSPVPSVSAVQRRSDTVHDHLSRRWVRYNGSRIQSTITCPVGECGTKAVGYSPRSPVPSVSAVQRRSDTVHDHLSRRWVRYKGGRIQSTITCPVGECGTKAVGYSPRSPVPSVSAVQRRSDTVHDHLFRRWVQYKGGRIQSTITCLVGECGTMAVGYSPRSPVPSVSAVQWRSDTVHDHLSRRWVRYKGGRIQSTITCPVGECGTKAVGYSPRSPVPSVSAVQRRSDTVHDHLSRRWVRYKGGRIQSTITCPVGECGTKAVGYSPRSLVPSVSAVQRRSDTVHDHLSRRWVRYKGGRIQSTITCPVVECGTKAVGYSPRSPVPSLSAVQRRSDTVHDHLSRRWVRYKGGRIQSTITCPVGECGTKAVGYSPRSPVPSVSAVQWRSDTVHDHLSRRWVRYKGGRIQSTITCPVGECGTKAVGYSPRSPVPSVSAVQRRSDTVHDHLSRRWVRYKGGRIQSTITCPVGECGTKAVGYSPRSPVPSVSAVQRRSDTVHDHLSRRWVRYKGGRIQSTITCPVGECGTKAVGYSPRSPVPSVSAVQRRSDTVHDHLSRRWVRYKGGRIQSTITCPVGECGTKAVGYSPRSPVPSVSAVQRRSDTVHDHLSRRWVRYKGGRIQSTITCPVGECGTKAVGYSPRSPVPSVSAVQWRSDTVHDHLSRRWVRYNGGRIQSTITCPVGECGTKAVGYSPRSPVPSVSAVQRRSDTVHDHLSRRWVQYKDGHIQSTIISVIAVHRGSELLKCLFWNDCCEMLLSSCCTHCCGGRRR